MSAVIEPVLPDGEVDLARFDGGFADNDWQENPNGQDYTSRISAAGRSELLDWARDQLQPRIQRVFEEFSERYGWGDPGDIRYSLRPERAGDRSGREAGRAFSKSNRYHQVWSPIGCSQRVVSLVQCAVETGLLLVSMLIPERMMRFFIFISMMDFSLLKEAT